MPLRIAIVTDIHHGKDSPSKKGTAALPLMAEFSAFVADAKPDFVLDLGDRISDEGPETDLRLEAEVHEAFQPVRETAPVWHINGNHDRDYLTVAQNEAILGQGLGHESRDLGDWQLILWRADTLIRREGPGGHNGFLYAPGDLAWLEAAIEAATKPVLIASHVPVSGHSQVGNYYFERNPASSTYPQADKVRAALRRLKTPAAWVSGHVHWNTVTTVDGIPHLTQQSLTEAFVTADEPAHGTPAGAFGLLELSADAIDWQVLGADAFRFSAPLAQMARRWFPPMPPFEDIPGQEERRAALRATQARLGLV